MPMTEIKNNDTLIIESLKFLVDHLKHIHNVKMMQ
jgi:hypothetical protein